MAVVTVIEHDATSSTPSSWSAPATQRAVIIDDSGETVVRDDYKAPIPHNLAPDEFIVRTQAVAINPSDTKMKGDFAIKGGVLGIDFAGTVVAVGRESAHKVAVGDLICSAQNAMHESTPERGAFAEYNVTGGGLWLKLPRNMAPEAGASLGCAVWTAALAIWTLGLPLPIDCNDGAPVRIGEMEYTHRPLTVLVWGGSTATGTMAIQLLKLANIVPIATCSPKNFDLVKSYGASQVFDSYDPEAAARIRAYTKNNLAFALDCITNIETTEACFNAIGRGGGKYVALNPFDEEIAASRKIVSAEWVLGTTLAGHGSTWPTPYGRPPSDEMRRLGLRLASMAQKLLDEGRLRHHPLRVLDGGIEAVLDGLELMRTGAVSAEKVVVRLAG